MRASYAARVARAEPNGYTLLIQSVASHVSNAHLYNKLPYDALRDFTGVSPVAMMASVVTVHPSLPVRTVKEFIALAKSRPGEILHGHSGNGSFTHLNGVMFEFKAGIRMNQVPFKGASARIPKRTFRGLPIDIGNLEGVFAALADLGPDESWGAPKAQLNERAGFYRFEE